MQQKFIQLIDSVAKGAFKKWALEKIAVEEEAERRYVRTYIGTYLVDTGIFCHFCA